MLTRIAAAAALILAVPMLARADEWKRVEAPLPGEYSNEAAAGAALSAARTGASDFQLLNNVLDSVKASQPSADPCGVIGLMAAVAATSRDQGQSRAEQLGDAICGFDRLVSGTHAALKWSPAFELLIGREIDFVYRHPEMSGAQAMTYWSRICESPFGTAAAPQQQPIESLPTP